MLVLTRKAGQEIRIGDGIWIKINSIQGERVRVGITAKSEIQVRRGELDSRVANGEPLQKANVIERKPSKVK